MAQLEQQARAQIDGLLKAGGWHVCDPKDANIAGHLGVAIREFPLRAGHGFADYLETWCALDGVLCNFERTWCGIEGTRPRRKHRWNYARQQIDRAVNLLTGTASERRTRFTDITLRPRATERNNVRPMNK